MNTQKISFWIGSYTTALPHAPHACGEGILYGEIDRHTGEIGTRPLSGLTPNPSYLVVQGKRLTAISERPGESGEIHYYRIKGSSLVLKSKEDSGACAPCHLAYIGDTLIVAHYHADRLHISSPAGRCTTAPYWGCGPVSTRQNGPHLHHVLWIQEKEILVICDLGSDRVWLHEVRDGRIIPEVSSALELPGGTGPRHSVWHRPSQRLFVLGELSGTVCSIGLDGQMLRGYQPQKAPIAPQGAAIRLHPNGRMLYISERGESRIDAFCVEEAGVLNWHATIDSGGLTPRDFNIDPSGRWMIVANQDDSTLIAVPLDPETGKFAGVPLKPVRCLTPVCIVFS